MAEFEVNGALVDGKYFTRDQKQDHKFVEKVAKAYGEYVASQERWAAFLLAYVSPVFICRASESDDSKTVTGKGVTVNNIPKNRRVIIKQNAYMKMNEYARQAKEIIDALLLDTAEKLPADVTDLFELLKTMFVEKKRLVYTPGIAAFVGMKNIRNKELLKAQELLRKAMDSEVGRVYCYVERKGEDGSWKVEGK